jgi:hypothetical protein
MDPDYGLRNFLQDAVGFAKKYLSNQGLYAILQSLAQLLESNLHSPYPEL